MIETRGWWNRNLLGLLALLPMLALVVGVRWQDIYHRVWKDEPRIAVTAAQEQWAEFNGAKVRLVEFGPAGPLETISGKPIVLPEGAQIWQATLEFDAPVAESDESPNPFGGCRVKLEDSQRRLYQSAPSEVSSVRGQSVFGACTRGSEQKGVNPYSGTMLFLAPTSARPISVQIHLRGSYPRFVRLTVTG